MKKYNNTSEAAIKCSVKKHYERPDIIEHLFKDFEGTIRRIEHHHQYLHTEELDLQQREFYNHLLDKVQMNLVAKVIYDNSIKVGNTFYDEKVRNTTIQRAKEKYEPEGYVLFETTMFNHQRELYVYKL
jgi:hypothetical protein